jgi:nicotinamidase/pyrazinamidase
VLWPDHCVAGSAGAEFHPDLARAVERAHLIVRKGYNPGIDSYSAFFEKRQGHRHRARRLSARQGGEALRLRRLAYDFCVAWSALDAVRLGFERWW